MKYAFRPFDTGSSTGVGNNWGHPPKPQACPQSETNNLKPQTTSTTGGLHAEKVPADNSVVASATAPGAPMTDRRFDTSGEQKWLRRIWGLSLLLVLLAATGVLVFSLIQPPSATSNMVRSSSKGNINGMPMPAPAVSAGGKPEAHAPDAGLATPATVAELAKHSAGTSADPNMIENGIAQPAAVANTQCSGARQALALCDTH